MAKVGRALGWDWNVDQDGIQQIVDFTNQASNGIKCRYEHPEGYAADLGTAVGVLKNARVVGDSAVADLHILKAADKSPLGQLGTYVITLATEQPDFISLSIYGSVKEFYFIDASGSKVTLITSDQWNQFYEAGPGTKLYINIGELTACDLVDKGALTDGLFSASAEFNKYVSDNQKFSLQQKTMTKGKRLAFSINATTDANVEITIKTDNPTPAVGDEVVAIDADGVESPAPDGAHKISGGSLDGSTINVKDGKIESIDTPAAAAAGADPNPVVTAAAGDNAELLAELKKISARIGVLERSPLAAHAGTAGADTFQGNQGQQPTEKSDWEKIAFSRFEDSKKAGFPEIPQ